MKSKDQLKRKLKRNQKKTDLIPLPKNTNSWPCTVSLKVSPNVTVVFVVGQPFLH